MFWTPEDWAGIATEIEVQGIINHHAVGSPASVVNACAAIEAGVSYVGNLSQQAYGHPADLDVKQMANTVIAIAAIAAERDAGFGSTRTSTTGSCASFHDAATSLGWCLLHGAWPRSSSVPPTRRATAPRSPIRRSRRPSVSRSTRSTSPASRPPWSTATPIPSIPPTRWTAMPPTSRATSSSPSRTNAHPPGAAVHATPVTEPIRIPTAEDIVQSLELGNEAERRAREALPLISDRRPVHALRDRILDGGRHVYASMLAGLAALGVDVDYLMQLLIATKRLGASRIEELWGAGEPDSDFPRGFRPVAQTDTLARLPPSRVSRRCWRASWGCLRRRPPRPHRRGGVLGHPRVRAPRGGLRAREPGGCEIVDLGTSVDNEIIAAAAAETAADAVALSTYNGAALRVVEDLVDEARAVRSACRGLRGRAADPGPGPVEERRRVGTHPRAGRLAVRLDPADGPSTSRARGARVRDRKEMPVSEHHALIVGGGTGIGYATAERLARACVAVALAGRREEVLDEARDRLLGTSTAPPWSRRP